MSSRTAQDRVSMSSSQGLHEPLGHHEPQDLTGLLTASVAPTGSLLHLPRTSLLVMLLLLLPATPTLLPLLSYCTPAANVTPTATGPRASRGSPQWLQAPEGLQAQKIRTPCLQDPYDYGGFWRLRASKHVRYAHLASEIPRIMVASGA